MSASNIISLLGGLGAVARWYPGLIQDGRQAVVTWLQRIMPQKPPTEPLEAGVRLYDRGGSLVQADEYLRLALQSKPDDPRAQIYHSNVLALSVPMPVQPVRLGIVYPQGQTEALAAVALAQALLNRRGGVNGRPLVLILGDYPPGGLPARIESMATGQDSPRANPRAAGAVPDAILIYPADQIDSTQLQSSVPLYFAQSGQTGSERELPADRPWPVQEIKTVAGERRILAANLALSNELKGAGLEAPEFNGSNDHTVVVARPEDVAGFQYKALLLLAEREDLLPPAREVPGAQALVRFSPQQTNDIAAEGAQRKLTLEQARAVDALLWLVHGQFKLNGLEGVTLSWNKNDKPVPVGWTLYRATPQGWIGERTLEAQAP